MSKDYYKILGVKRDATEDEIKKAYKKGALKYHPDRQSGKSEKEQKEAEEKFKEMLEAYQVLSDPDKKRQYDTFGTVGSGGFSSGGMTMEEAMAAFMRFGGMGGMDMDDFFGGHRQKVYKGSDIKLRVKITMSEIYNGGQKNVKYNKMVRCKACNGTGSKNGKQTTCPHCNGSGQFVETTRNGFSVYQKIMTCPHCGGSGTINTNPCQECGGNGLVRQKSSITINVPSVEDFNKVVCYNGMGNSCQQQVGIDGDLYVINEIVEEDGFAITHGLDIKKKVEIPIFDCLTGCETKIIHLDGKTVNVKVPPLSKDESVVRVRGLGFRTKNGSVGDLLVVVKHKMPDGINKEEIALLNEVKNKLKW